LLEQELGQHLLVRNGRGVEPTEAGLRLMDHSRALLALAARAKEDLQTFQRTPTGKVAIGLPPRIARVLTSPLVQRFVERFPGASISVAEGLSVSMRESLIAGRVELALLYDPPTSPQLAFESLFRENLVLVANTSLRPRLPALVKVDDLGQYPLVLPSRPHAIRSLVEKVCSVRGVRPHVVAEVDAVETIAEMALQGYACAILPRSAVRGPEMESSVAIGMIVSPSIQNDLVLATSRSRPITQLAVGCTELLRTLDIGGLLRPNPS
jgi:LysR family nitrogen assimilation transcriptional regulator